MAILFLIGAIATFITSANTQTAKKCNPYLLRYFNGAVKSFDQVRFEPTVLACENEFKLSGSCCESESLRDFIIRNTAADTLRWNNAIKSTYHFKTEILPNVNDIYNKVVSLLPYIRGEVRMGRMPQHILSAASFAAEHIRKITGQDYQRREDLYKLNAQTCFQELAWARNSALCTLCSSRPETFYNGDRLRIKLRSCESVLQSCFETFRFMFMNMAIPRALYDITNAIRTNGLLYPMAKDALSYLRSFNTNNRQLKRDLLHHYVLRRFVSNQQN